MPGRGGAGQDKAGRGAASVLACMHARITWARWRPAQHSAAQCSAGGLERACRAAQNACRTMPCDAMQCWQLPWLRPAAKCTALLQTRRAPVHHCPRSLCTLSPPPHHTHTTALGQHAHPALTRPSLPPSMYTHARPHLHSVNSHSSSNSARPMALMRPASAAVRRSMSACAQHACMQVQTLHDGVPAASACTCTRA